jgi:hypothetical protein
MAPQRRGPDVGAGPQQTMTRAMSEDQGRGGDGEHAPEERFPIVIASMSRSGSTMLFDAVQRAWARARFGERADEHLAGIGQSAWRLDEVPLLPGGIYKTHDLPGYLPRAARAKVLFTYRRATDVALSIATLHNRKNGEGWFEKHRHHMRGQGGYEDFLAADSLGLERQVDAWSAAQGLDVLGLRYDALWGRLPEIEAFLGLAIELPARERIQRPSRTPPGEVERIRATYAALDRKIEAMPDMFLLRA